MIDSYFTMNIHVTSCRYAHYDDNPSFSHLVGGETLPLSSTKVMLMSVVWTLTKTGTSSRKQYSIALSKTGSLCVTLLL